MTVLAAVALIVTACGSHSGSGSGGSYSVAPPAKLTAETFIPVCEGATVSTATAYDKASPTGHKAVYLSTYKDGNLLDSSSSVLPPDWTVTYDANQNTYAAIDLVICAKRTTRTLVKNCDGYTVDDKPDSLVVKWYNATYTVTIHEATTGKQIATTDIVTDDGECPQSEYMVPKGTSAMDDYATIPNDKIVAFAKPFAQP